MQGYSLILFLVCLLFVWICGILARQWTVYSYTPKNAASPLSKLRSCQKKAQDTQFCGAKLVNGTDCELLKTEECDILPNGSECSIHMRKTSVRFESPFNFINRVRLSRVTENVPVNIRPGSAISLVVTPLDDRQWIYLRFLSGNINDTFWAYTNYTHGYLNARSAIDYNIYNPYVSYPMPLVSNTTYELKISHTKECIQMHVNGSLYLQRQLEVPPLSMGRIRVFVNRVDNTTTLHLHSIQFDAASLNNDN